MPASDLQQTVADPSIATGNPTFGLRNTPKVVGGIDQPSTDAVAAFFGAFVEQVVPVPGTGEAEPTKILENTFRHVNITLVNELAMFAHQLDIDINAAIDAAATKPFGFMAFRPGPGVGGHCLPVDPSYLSWRVKTQLGESFRFIELANDINDHEVVESSAPASSTPATGWHPVLKLWRSDLACTVLPLRGRACLGDGGSSRERFRGIVRGLEWIGLARHSVDHRGVRRRRSTSRVRLPDAGGRARVSWH